MADEFTLDVRSIPEGHVCVGYIAYMKLLDQDGKPYWASRSRDLDAMEMLGMATDLQHDFQKEISGFKAPPG